MIKLDTIFSGSRRGNFHVPKGMVITGTFTAGESGNIAGTVNGDVYVNGKITVSKDAVIRGDIIAIEIVVYGTINGDIKCSGKMTVYPGAYIKGNISTSEIHIERDAFVEGIITKTIGEPFVPELAENDDQENGLQKETPAILRAFKRNEDISPETWF